MFEPWFSKAGVTWSDGPVASLRVQAAEVSAASVSEARTNHLVVERDMAFPFSGRVWVGATANLRGAGSSF